jgi:hypothetical protein
MREALGFINTTCEMEKEASKFVQGEYKVNNTVNATQI